MRIVAGALRGRILVAPKGQSTRPTADRTRQALFNILEHAAWSQGLRDLRVLDVFAGSGALGFEALSRGAASAAFLETARDARAAIEANIAALELGDRARLSRRDAVKPGVVEGEAADIAFLDPPYAKGLGERALAGLAEGGWLAAGALVVFERGVDEAAPLTPGFEPVDDRTFGAARVWFLRAR